MIKPIFATLFCAAALALGQTRAAPPPAKGPQSAPTLTYNQLISAGYDLLKEARIEEAYLAATRAAEIDPKRFEAYALAALALHVHGSDQEAKSFMEKAVALVPPDRKSSLSNLATQITSAQIRQNTSSPAMGMAQAQPTAASLEIRRKLDALRLIIEDADRANTKEARRKFLVEFLRKSEPFTEEHPDEINVWTLRAAAALELNDPKAGQEAGRRLVAAGVDRTGDVKTRKLMAMLERLGWAGDASPVPAQPASNQAVGSSRAETVVVPVGPSTSNPPEAILWEAIENGTRAEDYQGYLSKYPEGIFAPIAKARLDAISYKQAQEAVRQQEAKAATLEASAWQGTLSWTSGKGDKIRNYSAGLTLEFTDMQNCREKLVRTDAVVSYDCSWQKIGDMVFVNFPSACSRGSNLEATYVLTLQNGTANGVEKCRSGDGEIKLKRTE